MPDVEKASGYARDARCWLAAVAAAVVALAVRVGVVVAVPIMPDGDGYSRLACVNQLVVHAWLPLYQVTLRSLALLTSEPQAFRLLTAAEGAWAAAAVALLVGRVRGPAGALVAGLVVALCPALVLPATGLYQESLFVALVAGGFLGAAEGRAWGALLLLLATWTRYEGWAAALVGALLLPRRYAWVPLLGPVVWLFGEGLSGAGVDFALTPMRLFEEARVLRSLAPYWVGWPLIAVATLGALRGRLDRLEQAVMALAAVDLVAVAVFHPFSPVDNARQLVVPALALAVLAGRAAAGGGVLAIAAIVAAAAIPLPQVVAGTTDWAGRATDARRAALGERVAGQVRPGERVLVVSPGEQRWPGAEPDGCLFVAVWARLPRERVVCDTEVPDGDLRSWLDATNVALVVVLGEGALPIHRRVADEHLPELAPGLYLARR